MIATIEGHAESKFYLRENEANDAAHCTGV